MLEELSDELDGNGDGRSAWTPVSAYQGLGVMILAGTGAEARRWWLMLVRLI